MNDNRFLIIVVAVTVCILMAMATSCERDVAQKRRDAAADNLEKFKEEHRRR